MPVQTKEFVDSKPITHSDDASKLFIKKVLKKDKTLGFDLDAIHWMDEKYGNIPYIFEYLKDECETLSPHKSDPKYYPKNWHKFWALYKVAYTMRGCLILVNYSDGFRTVKADNGDEIKVPLPSNYENEVRVMNVSRFNTEKIEQYLKTPYKERPKTLQYMEYAMDLKMTTEEYSEFLREINRHSRTWG